MSFWQLVFGLNGRVRRTHWWLVRLGAVVVMAVLVFGLISATSAIYGQDVSSEPVSAVGGSILILLYLMLLWIDFALTVKRFHDRGKSGVWYLIGLVPLIGGLWILIECGFLDGTQGPNEHGPSPKGIGNEDLTAATFA